MDIRNVYFIGRHLSVDVERALSYTTFLNIPLSPTHLTGKEIYKATNIRLQCAPIISLIRTLTIAINLHDSIGALVIISRKGFFLNITFPRGPVRLQSPLCAERVCVYNVQ